ncbi:cation-transporting ATPase [Bdellovibrio bacteriovorus]|uniref:Putative cation-transporting ATPase n=1 Tax=Bdellovibrio bacteriovorus (strain ATCC 15356 / DSM 50701 / NCIMB 9529 / HD100) TaxID=264462 RepID=Q6MPT9_BDEBA|nr:hypothetical protein [Bdellovibrio bacteriovorus]CAE78708.1 putative cation-transporting ATPase [Bdellovibrio bacteriovorus HD100]
MKSILLSLTLLLNVQAAFAWSVESAVGTGPRGEFQDTVTLYCRPDETLCQEVCKNQNSCWKEQELCFNCLGTTNPILRTVFTEIDRLYRTTQRVLPQTEVAKVFTKDHVFVAAKSIYNFYSAIDNQEVLARFQGLCPTGSGQPLIVLEKNKFQEPSRIKFIVCDGAGQYDQGMYVMEYNPQVETGNSSEIKVNSKP